MVYNIGYGCPSLCKPLFISKRKEYDNTGRLTTAQNLPYVILIFCFTFPLCFRRSTKKISTIGLHLQMGMASGGANAIVRVAYELDTLVGPTKVPGHRIVTITSDVN